MYVLKGCGHVFVKSLSVIYNLSLKHEVFPDAFKLTIVTPIFKGGAGNSIKNTVQWQF